MADSRSATDPGAALRDRVAALTDRVRVLRAEIQRVVHGQDALIDDLLIALVAGGHVLLEGLPGLGKTLLARSLASCLGLEYSRVQFTPDLMPADVTGTMILEEAEHGRQFRFQPGPLFANLVLADEINRATPKTQSALLQAMQEHAVTVGTATHALPSPFVVIATQNPIELEGTFPLPEAQLDRFMFKLVVRTPALDDVVRILDDTTSDEPPVLRRVLAGDELLELRALARQVLCAEPLVRLVAELLAATDPERAPADARTKRLVRYGASPRAGQAIILAAKVRALLDQRASVSLEDLQAPMLAALRHRVVLSFEADADGVTVADLLDEWLQRAVTKTGL